MPPPPVTLTFDLLTLKVVSESRGYLCANFSVLNVRDRQTSDRRQTSLNASRYKGAEA